MPLRLIKVFLVLSVGFWGLVGAFGNVASLPSVYESVSEVTSMAGIPDGAAPPWRTTNSFVVTVGVAVIVLGKFAALLAGVGGILMLKNIRAPQDVFQKSKKWAVAGSGLAFALMFFGFTVMAESVFFTFVLGEGGAGELAFRYSASLALVALFVAQMEDE